ncbi:DoxX family protein [Micromonospora avicenniae]|uniref:Uncharacterized membrane protein YphA, DoxX/SURF4 family n=1 Tax=Micromonospora avicenniae TaxID=1198245 RepID=A0A1N6TP51_9ACTN|nr:DoxX family protein [Micromonospora avicenniae]SIQ54856.1 Uncharacterized membrane protein YphA, DoxX/SURF4 family [Micromonospora avicenniae]
MKPVRSLARAMLSGIFVVGGCRNFTNPERLAPTAKPIVDRVEPLLEQVNPRIPTDAVTLIRATGAVQVGAGLLFATGKLTRPMALVLAGTLVPVTLAGHRFWENEDPLARANNRVHFLKNVGILGGLLLAAADTQGKPGIRWRTGHRIGHSRRSVQRAVRSARREARVAAARAASTARRLPG